MIKSGAPNIPRQHGGRRKLPPHALLDIREVCQAWHTGPASAITQINVRVPYPPQCARYGVRHAGQVAYALKFGKTALVERSLDCGLKKFRHYRIQEPAGQTGRDLRKIEYLQPALTRPRGSEPPHLESERSLDNNGPPLYQYHLDLAGCGKSAGMPTGLGRPIFDLSHATALNSPRMLH